MFCCVVVVGWLQEIAMGCGNIYDGAPSPRRFGEQWIECVCVCVCEPRMFVEKFSVRFALRACV